MSFENWKDNVNDSKFVCSWSGGKDSCMALYRASRIGQPVKLFTMFNETGVKSRSHGLSLPFVQLQAEALGLPIEIRSVTWDAYEAEFVTALCHFKEEGVQAVVFGDIDLEEHGLWEEKVCNNAGLKLSLPLWKNERRELVTE
ncbi:MAG TPA: ATPase, partial [Desulfosporosinus sp.]|nr:ATPase [Desulfosporosinus sp.]